MMKNKMWIFENNYFKLRFYGAIYLSRPIELQISRFEKLMILCKRKAHFSSNLFPLYSYIFHSAVQIFILLVKAVRMILI